MNRSAKQPAFLDELGDQFARIARQSARGRAARRYRPLRSPLLTGAAILLLAGGAGAATGVVPIPGGGPDFVAQEASGSFSPELTERIAVLSRSRTDADSMGSAAAYLSGSDRPAPASSLRVKPPAPPAGTPHATATTLPIWLVPTASGAVSMQILPPGATGPASGFAADVSMLEAGRAWMTVDHDFAGLAPDGVERVIVMLRDGKRVDLPVEGNVYGAHFDMAVDDVRLVD
jgi:hypothetical protein